MNDLSSSLSRWTRSAALGASAAIVWIVAVTVLADLFPGLKNWLKETFAHHWLGKGYLAAAVFFLVFLIAPRPVESVDAKTDAAIRLVSWLALIGSVVLMAFFLYELS